MDVLALTLEAPIMSFGGVSIDAYGPTLHFPPKTLLVGLIGNAFGYRREDIEKLNALGRHIRFVAIPFRVGEVLEDYQSTDLGQDFMDAKSAGWTTWGARQERGGDPKNQRGTDIRHRQYLQDASVTVVISLVGNGAPSVRDVQIAIREPARPLYIGRKGCIPSAPLVRPDALLSSGGLLSAAAVVGLSRLDYTRTTDEPAGEIPVIFPRDAVQDHEWPHLSVLEEFTFSEGRDWGNRIHTGTARYVRGTLSLEAGGGDG